MIPKGYLSKNNSEPIVKTSFDGLCNIYNAEMGDFYAMKNLTFDEASHLTVREARRFVAGIEGQVMAFFFLGNRYCFVTSGSEGTYLHISDHNESGGFKALQLSDTKWVHPVKWVLVGNRMFLPAFGKVIDLEILQISDTTETFGGGMLEHTYDQEGYQVLGSDCVRFSYPIAGFSSGERVTLVLHQPSGDDYYPVRAHTVEQTQDGTCFYLDDATLPDETNHAEISIMRSMPAFTDMAFHNKRMWGCNGQKLYFSAENEPLLWQGDLALDENEAGVIEVDVGTQVTHFCVVGSRLFALSANKIYEITGDDSDSFKAVLRLSIGVDQKDTNATAAVGNALYFMSGGDVYRYEGNTLKCISEGLHTLSNGIAQGDNGHYYLYANGHFDSTGFYTYHEKEGGWSFEETEQLTSLYCGQGFVIGTLNRMAQTDISGVVVLRTNGLANQRFNEYVNLTGTKLASEGAVDSYGEIQFAKKPGEKLAYSALAIDLDMGADSNINFMICYDGSIHTQIGTIYGKKERGTKVFPLPRRRSESWKLILSGSGSYTIYSIVLK